MSVCMCVSWKKNNKAPTAVELARSFGEQRTHSYFIAFVNKCCSHAHTRVQHFEAKVSYHRTVSHCTASGRLLITDTDYYMTVAGYI